MIGNLTRGALTGYQEANGLPANGLLTREVLDSLLLAQFRIVPAFFQSPESIRHITQSLKTDQLVTFDFPDKPPAEAEDPLTETSQKDNTQKKKKKASSSWKRFPVPSGSRITYEGRWTLFTHGETESAYEVFLPSDWSLTASYSENRSYQISYEPEKTRQDGIELFTILLIGPGEPADMAMEEQRHIAGIYKKYGFDNTAVVRTTLGDFSGNALIAIEEKGQLPPSYTLTFAGRNPLGEVLVTGVSAVSHSVEVREFLGQLYSTIRMATQADRTGPEPAEVTPSPAPLPSPTPVPTVTLQPSPSPLPQSRQDFYGESAESLSSGESVTVSPEDELFSGSWAAGESGDEGGGDEVIITTITTVEEFTSGD